MRTPRDVSIYLSRLEDVINLQKQHDAEHRDTKLESIPSEILLEREKFIAGEIEYAELSIGASLWVMRESMEARRKDPIIYSDLPTLLDRETWPPAEAMLILAGIDPNAAILDWSYRNFMGAEIHKPKIHHANWFSSTSDLYDYPIAADSELTSSELKKMIKEGESHEFSSSEIEHKLDKLQARLEEAERWENDNTSIFKSSMLELRAEMVGILKTRWDSGDHEVEARRSPAFFIQWAETRGFEIEWASWARASGYIDTDPPATAPPFFDADSEDYPKLLHIAVRAWDHARHTSKGTAKQRIAAFLHERYPDLSASEKEAISMIGNWQKSGGRPKTGG
ncbi:hypothetical protein CBP36_12135 [Acidovorax carolinensis]|uniref:Uncharacterized protein n=1 Tax=Acidovorax carolinensis TaxID=553814 RepID=A0A240UDC6_9BURK|nr:hypothetical protein [Acidovorax carolinensis]ART59488.1 hypothetical protein CBP36_12135 [Acidovorax carolinensis]